MTFQHGILGIYILVKVKGNIKESFRVDIPNDSFNWLLKYPMVYTFLNLKFGLKLYVFGGPYLPFFDIMGKSLRSWWYHSLLLFFKFRLFMVLL